MEISPRGSISDEENESGGPILDENSDPAAPRYGTLWPAPTHVMVRYGRYLLTLWHVMAGTYSRYGTLWPVPTHVMVFPSKSDRPGPLFLHMIGAAGSLLPSKWSRRTDFLHGK